MKRMNAMVIVTAIAACGLAGMTFAAAPATDHSEEAHVEQTHAEEPHLAYDHPTVPEPARWAGATVVGIIGSFVIAAAVGIGVRLNMPEELPPTHSHDEPPGASHHHGPGGTVQPGPEHDLPGGHAHGSSGHH